MGDNKLLECAKKIPLPPNTKVYMTDTGTVFYHYDYSPTRLYAKINEEAVDSKIPEYIYGVMSHGNVIYFHEYSTVYKAILTSAGVIDVSVVRSKLEGEDIDLITGLCTIEKQGGTYVYRICDDPKRDGILVDLPQDELKGLKLKGIHNGRAIYLKENIGLGELKIKWSDKLIVIEGFFVTIHTGSSGFIYMCNSYFLHTINTKTMEVLPTMKIDDACTNTRTVTVQDGVIVIQSTYNGDHLLLAKLPPGYFQSADITSQLQTMQRFVARTNDSSSSFSSNSLVTSSRGGDASMKSGLAYKQTNDSFSSNSLVTSSRGKDASMKSGLADKQAIPYTAALNSHDSKAENVDFDSEFAKKFKTLNILGTGGFGCVFEVQNLMDKWNYAVKRIPLRGSPEAVNEALEEVCTLASIRHEGIVGYNSSWIEKPPIGWQKRSDASLLDSIGSYASFDHSDDCVFIYIQMELCKQTLKEWLETNKSRDLVQAKNWFKQLVSAVNYLHKKNKIHRDLKPSNILFDAEGRIKLCDLGLVANRAMNNGQEVDRTRTAVGTLMYMAPEQLGTKYSSKVDIFSLGLILSELCTFMTIFDALEVFQHCRHGRMSNTLKHLPDVAKMVSWLTNLDANMRPDCEEILAHEFLSNKPKSTVSNAPQQNSITTLTLHDLGKLSKPIDCIQLQTGSFALYDDEKPFKLSKNPLKADLSILDAESNCSYRGAIGKHAFFSTINGKVMKIYLATVEEKEIKFRLINKLNTSDVSQFNSEPVYFIELSREWSVYQLHEDHTKKEGEKFDISEINQLSKYEHHYHKGILYLFRERPMTTIKRVNKKVVIMEGALLGSASVHAYPNSESIYILDSERKVIMILNTTSLALTVFRYEPPAN